MSFKSNERRAIITGASSGIGRATAKAFAKAGISVALVSRSLEKLQTVAEEIREIGGLAQVYSLDLLDLKNVKEKMELITKDFGGVDILVNNAGMGQTQSLAEISLESWQQVLNMNLTSVVVAVQGVLPQMRQQKQGTIINIASVAARNAFPNWGAYCVSKAGLISFSEVLALEERSNGIRVMIISPGSVNTAIWDSETVKADFDRTLMLKPETVAQTILQAALLPAEAVIQEMTILPNIGTF